MIGRKAIPDEINSGWRDIYDKGDATAGGGATGKRGNATAGGGATGKRGGAVGKRGGAVGGANSADEARKRWKGSLIKKLMAVNIFIVLMVLLYFFVVFTDIPLVAEARDIWIETAMTTADHQWLATGIFPGWLIDRVMSRQVVTDEGTVSNPNLLLTGGSQKTAGDAGSGDMAGRSDGAYPADGGGALSAQQGFDGSGGNGGGAGGAGGASGAGSVGGSDGEGGENNAPRSIDGTASPDIPESDMFDVRFFYGMDVLTANESPARPSVGDKDEFGNTVIVSDETEDITIIEIRKTAYVGRIIFVPDPSRVVVKNTHSKNVQGELIKSYLTKYNAIAGMNGNGFDDPEGHGKGGTIIGWSVSDGEAWGSGSKSEYASVALTDQNVLLVGGIKDFAKYNIRDLAQYGPTLIVDGKKLISGSGGWGVQPRTGIGQREDGTILMATFDGRQPGHSLGITAGEVADIFKQYGCINAGLCDGGSSSVMMYDGKVVGKPSTPMKDTGRYLPNAFLVLSKQPLPDDDDPA